MDTDTQKAARLAAEDVNPKTETGADPNRRFGNAIDDEAADSFPASDPPSHTPVTGNAFPSEETIKRAADKAEDASREEHAKV